jgi:hypothetical protein
MMVTKHYAANAKRRAAEARRYIDEMRNRIAGLRRSGADTSAAESQLQTMLPVVERFEAYVESMQPPSGRENAAGA